MLMPRPLPGRLEWLFSLKMYGAAMAALFIAFWLDLPRPSWSVLTICIVSQPRTGMLQSKALYRVVGTVVGSAVAVVVIVGLAGSPELQTLALAAWLAGCVYVTVIDRTPRSYAFMLAGYTASFIAFPSVGAPETIFSSALARVEEITLGILCAMVVDMVVFPQRVGPLLQRRLDSWIADAGRWTADVLTGRTDDAEAAADRSRLIMDAGALEALRVHAQYDMPELRSARSGIHSLQHRMHMLLSVLVSIRDRIATLRDVQPARLAALRPTLDLVIARWAAEAGPDARADAELAGMLNAHMPSPAAMRTDPHVLLYASVVTRLEDLVRHWAEIRRLRRRIARGERERERHAPVARHRDHRLAVLSGLAAAAAVLITTAFWIPSGWPQGSSAVMMAAVACSLFSSLDDPTPAVVRFLAMSVLAVAVAAVYVLAVLPGITGFPLLAAALAVLMVPLGAWLAIPDHVPTILPLLLSTIVMLDLQNGAAVDVTGFANGAIAQVIGLGIGAGVLRILRALGRDWTVRRMTAAVRSDLARLAAGDPGLDRKRFEGRMFDRLGGLFLRVGGSDSSAPITNALAGLRVGLNILRLRATGRRLPAEALGAVDGVLEALNRHFLGRDGERMAASDRLRGGLDATIARLSALEATPATTDALLALVGIRHALFHHVEFFAVEGLSETGRRNRTNQRALVP